MEQSGAGEQRLLVTPEEVARLLGVGRTRVFALLRTGELRSVKLGRSRRIPYSAVTDYVAGLEDRARQEG